MCLGNSLDWQQKADQEEKKKASREQEARLGG